MSLEDFFSKVAVTWGTSLLLLDKIDRVTSIDSSLGRETDVELKVT